MAMFNGFLGDYSGLTEEKVKVSQEQYGRNELVPEKKSTFFGKLLSILKEPMFILLFGTALIYFLLREPRDGSIMIGFVLFMSGINIFQEWRTDKTLQALKDMSSPHVRVIRENQVQNIDTYELTVGDLFIMEEGEKVPADGLVVEMFDLGLDESSLTGESEVVWKRIQISDEEKKENWRADTCYAGTTVTQGSAIVQVMKIGPYTEYGKIGTDILSIPQKSTPLEKQTRHLIKVCAFIGLSFFILVFVITFMHFNSMVKSLLAGITLAMAMIPEEFPVILTVFLAMGAWRLARKNALIRRMPAVETLGAISVLCVDKTGTLTKNQMTVQETYAYQRFSEEKVLYLAALGCEIEPYDPMEKAILQYAIQKEVDPKQTVARTLVFEYPFSSETKMMGHVWDFDGIPMLAAKGSPESILPLCKLSKDEKVLIEIEQEKLARKGYRVIAVATRTDMAIIPEKLNENELSLVGLIGLEDPPREAVPGAIKLCNKAGIRIIMITGDNGTTAASIAGKIGIVNHSDVVTGHQLEIMTDDELKEKLKTVNIFARVIPRHKMRIVKALKELGETVAMTGDGVNDAPALKFADIGIAMGKRGTGVAREAADMILLDDNFATIVDTIRDGRKIYDNIRKAIEYVFVVHIPIALIALLSPLLHLPALLLPIHVVMLELIIDPTCSIVFERQPEEKDIMNRHPRSQKDPLVNVPLLGKAILQGLVILAASLGAYIYGIHYGGWSTDAARTFALVILIFSNLFLVFVNRSEKEFSFLGIFKLKDRVVWYVISGVVVVTMLMIYIPAMHIMAKTISLSGIQLFTAITISGAATLWWDLVKGFKYVANRGK